MQRLPADDSTVKAVSVFDSHAEHHVSAALQGRQHTADAKSSFVFNVTKAKTKFAPNVANAKPSLYLISIIRIGRLKD